MKAVTIIAIAAIGGCSSGNNSTGNMQTYSSARMQTYNTAAEYCAPQGSTVGNEQCRHYYERHAYEPLSVPMAPMATTPSYSNPASGYSDPGPGFWLGMMGLGANMMTYQPPRPTITNCSTFGQRGQGMSCVSQ